MVADAAHANVIRVGVCGENGGRKFTRRQLLGPGWTSWERGRVARAVVGSAVQRLTMTQCKQLLEENPQPIRRRRFGRAAPKGRSEIIPELIA